MSKGKRNIYFNYYFFKDNINVYNKYFFDVSLFFDVFLARFRVDPNITLNFLTEFNIDFFQDLFFYAVWPYTFLSTRSSISFLTEVKVFFFSFIDDYLTMNVFFLSKKKHSYKINVLFYKVLNLFFLLFKFCCISFIVFFSFPFMFVYLIYNGLLFILNFIFTLFRKNKI
jgi:hypothetical protein